MDGQFSARHDLGRFNVTPHAIGRLESDIAALGGPRPLRLESIDLTTRKGRAAYETVEHLRADRAWEKRAKRFWLTFSERGDGPRPGVRSVRITGGEGTENGIEVLGDEEDWVAGTAQRVRELMKAHEVWHRHMTHSLLVHIVYPVLGCVALAYAISYWLGTPLSSMLGIYSAPEFAEDYYYRTIILVAALPLFALAYLVPTRSRILADRPWDPPDA